MVPGAIFMKLLLSSQLMNKPYKLVLHYTRLVKLAKDKHSSLFDLLISYEENENASAPGAIIFTNFFLRDI
jgi:hypothetical protein